MVNVLQLRAKIIEGYQIAKEETMELVDAPLEELCQAADEIRSFFCSDKFDICTIINGKSGRCSENCKFCAQSSFYDTEVETYPLLDTETCLAQAKYNDEKGVLRYSVVTSGKALNNQEVEQLCETYRAINEQTSIALCASLGLLQEEQYVKLKEAGVTRIHNNLETSRRNFPNICTTHTYDEKIASIKAAMKAGLKVCSGGLMGIGETMEDRIDMAFDLKELGIHSVPVNMLSPIKGTPYGERVPLTSDEMRRIVAIYRFILPDASIRLAGGRGLLEDKGESCFVSGANAVISGDLLTTSGMTIDADMKMIAELGYVPSLWER
ncbi:MAG: biotin synthase BioB [Eubacteriales bacterium]